MTLLFMGLGAPEIIFLVLLIMLFFGGKKIPELMRGIGKGVKSFKDGVNGMEDAGEAEKKKTDKADEEGNQ